jgi:TonB family protein
MIAALVAVLLAVAPGGDESAPCNAVSADFAEASEAATRRNLVALPPRVATTHLRDGCVLVSFRMEPDGSISNVRVEMATRQELGSEVKRATRHWRSDPGPAELGAVIIEFRLQRE